MGEYRDQDSYCKAMSERPAGSTPPILVLNAADDPVCSESNIDYGFFSNSSGKAILAVTPKGAHLAFFTGSRDPTQSLSWSEAVTMEFLDHVLKPWQI